MPREIISASFLPMPQPYTIVFAGDMMFDRSIRSVMNRAEAPIDPFVHVRELLHSADLAIGNLEGPVSSRGVRQGSIYSFRFDPGQTMGALLGAGLDIVTLANNHIWDYGRLAALDTMEHLRTAGIEYVGFGKDYEEANRPVIKTLGNNKIAFLGYTEFYSSALWADHRLGLSEFDQASITKRIQGLKASGEADIVVVNLHWGEEYKTIANEKQRSLARSLVRAGADLIIGHHPHVVQEVELVEGRWVAYSLGNFVFDQNFSTDTKKGLLIRATVKNKQIVSVEPLSLRFTQFYQPMFVE